MPKLFVKFLLSLCLFLLQGYGHLYARKAQPVSCHALVKIPQVAAQVKCATLPRGELCLIHTPSSSPVKIDDTVKVTEIEEDEDESVSVRKSAELCHSTITFLRVQASEQIVCSHKARLPFCKHFSYTSSYRHILLCTFRV